MKESPQCKPLSAILFKAKVNLAPLDPCCERIRRKLRYIAGREIAIQKVVEVHPIRIVTKLPLANDLALEQTWIWLEFGPSPAIPVSAK